MIKRMHSTDPDVPKPPRRLTRAGAIIVVTLLPAAIGLFHLLVHPLVPFPVQHPATVPTTSPSVPAEAPGMTRAKFAIFATFSLVFCSGMVSCLVLGLLRVRHAVTVAFFQACVSTLAHMVSDGQGAFLGPIAFTFLPFWPFIALDQVISGVFRR